MPWSFRCPACGRYMQKDCLQQERWRCACGWVGPEQPEGKETRKCHEQN